jgi:hypothetical protein
MTSEPALLSHHIGGAAFAGTGGRHGDVFDPATGAVAARVPLASKADTEAAIAAAQTAFPAWAAVTPLNRAWMKLGELMGRVVSPVVLGVIFFGVFTPVGLAMRLFGRDAMARQFDRRLNSYWVNREPPGPAEDSYRNMF